MNPQDRTDALFVASAALVGGAAGWGLWYALGAVRAGADAPTVPPMTFTGGSSRPPPPAVLPGLSGWKYTARSSPGITSLAVGLLGASYGTTKEVTIDGIDYLARVEPHYDNHPHGWTGPPYWHTGVSVYERA